jgi:hypothetical protein
LEIRNSKSTSLIKRHITGAKIVIPPMKLKKKFKDLKNKIIIIIIEIIIEKKIHLVDILIILIPTYIFKKLPWKKWKMWK